MNNDPYLEACSALRHYSTCIMHMRTTVIVQGIILLTATAYTLKLTTDYYFYLSVFFGVSLTVVLWVQQKNYLADFLSHLRYVDELEELVRPDALDMGPWASYKKDRQLREKKWYFTPVVVYGPFVFFTVVFVLLATLNISGCLPPVVEHPTEKASSTTSQAANPQLADQAHSSINNEQKRMKAGDVVRFERCRVMFARCVYDHL